MKRIVCTLLALSLLLFSFGSASALSYDMSTAKEYDTIFEITVDSDNDIAFIDCDALLSIKDRSFEHPYESENTYSYLYSDIVVIDYFQSENYPVWRTWIEYTGTKHIYTTAVTFEFDGNRYTFSGVSDSDRVTESENGDCCETLLIKYGMDNIDFLAGMESYINSLTDGEENLMKSILAKADVKMTLHGTEDVEIQVPASFVLEFWAIKVAFSAGGSLSDFLNESSSPTQLKVTSLQ